MWLLLQMSGFPFPLKARLHRDRSCGLKWGDSHSSRGIASGPVAFPLFVWFIAFVNSCSVKGPVSIGSVSETIRSIGSVDCRCEGGEPRRFEKWLYQFSAWWAGVPMVLVFLWFDPVSSFMIFQASVCWLWKYFDSRSFVLFWMSLVSSFLYVWLSFFFARFISDLVPFLIVSFSSFLDRIIAGLVFRFVHFSGFFFGIRYLPTSLLFPELHS